MFLPRAFFRMTALAVLVGGLLSQNAGAQETPCGGDFGRFVQGLAREAIARGHDPAAVRRFFAHVRPDPKVLGRHRAQGVFRLTFTEFARRVISKNRLVVGRRKAKEAAAILAEAERRFGVPGPVLLALWALETDYGAFQGDFNTLNALVTLAHDCRRPALFRPQIFAALSLFEKGDFDPARTTGAWAGEIGMVQMLPADILRLGVDGDGDGHVRLKESAADALLTGARLLKEFGWHRGEPWMVEVHVPPDLDWTLTGLVARRPVRAWRADGVRLRYRPRWPVKDDMPAAIILPQGRKGPAFMVFRNFDVFFEWNQSFVYVTTAAYFATRLAGAPPFDPGNPDPPLSLAEMKALQKKLRARGHDVGRIDGVLGAGTRAAVRKEQARLGLPADGWPTRTLLERL